MPHHDSKDSKAVDFGLLAAALATSAAMFFLASAVVWLLWNGALAPSTTNLKKIGYWKAAGILLLASMLFGGYHARPIMRQCFRSRHHH